MCRPRSIRSLPKGDGSWPSSNQRTASAAPPSGHGLAELWRDGCFLTLQLRYYQASPRSPPLLSESPCSGAQSRRAVDAQSPPRWGNTAGWTWQLGAIWQPVVLPTVGGPGFRRACRLRRGIGFHVAAGTDAHPGARRYLQHQSSAPRPTRFVASDRRASAAGAGKLATDGQLHRQCRDDDVVTGAAADAQRTHERGK